MPQVQDLRHFFWAASAFGARGGHKPTAGGYGLSTDRGAAYKDYCYRIPLLR
jgi:hypothetical protein